jgi:hypothetical protein
VATVHDVVKESGRVLHHPTAVFPVYALADTPWVAQTLSHCRPVKRGKVSSNSATHEGTQFMGPQEISYAPVHNSGMGYHLGAPNL